MSKPLKFTLMQRVERRWLRWALKRTKGNRHRSARLLGISIRTVRIWMIRYGLRKEFPHKNWWK